MICHPARVAAACLLFAAAPLAGPARANDYPLEHRETLDLVQLVKDAGELVSQGTEAACAAFHERGSRWFHDDVYVFVIDLEGRAVCHPAQTALEGRILREMRDPDGKPVVRNFLDLLADGREAGWVHYLWPRPGWTSMEWKSTYVRRVQDAEGHTLIVGSGLYQIPMERRFVVDKVNEAAALIARDGHDAFAQLRDPASGFRFLDTYVFVLNREGVELVNAGFPELEGQNLLDLRDARGTPIVRQMLELVKDKEAAWFEYLWPRPGDARPAEKSSYLRRVFVGDEMLVVGAGVYFN